MKGWPPTLNANEVDLEEARIVAWFATGLRHEAIRLTKKYRRVHTFMLKAEKPLFTRVSRNKKLKHITE